ncbi:hypothetical protein [Thioalkalivibrio sp.]|uniref:hypothetical protein n=1 Tax=Thioalkalivibrio sp. TaxID=2093813 RepID=UPI0035674F43
MNDDNHIPESVHKAIDEATWLALHVTGQRGSEVVRRVLGLARAELVAVLGHAGAAQQLRSLADRIKAEHV